MPSEGEDPNPAPHPSPGFPPPSPFSDKEIERLWAQFNTLRSKTDEHKILERLVGNWQFSADFDSFGFGPNFAATGDFTGRLIFEGRFLQMTGRAIAAIGEWDVLFILGYDTVIQKFHLIFIESLHNGVLIAEGPWDDDTKQIRTWGEFSNPMFNTRHDISVVIDFTQPTRIKISMRVPDREGRFIDSLVGKFSRRPPTKA